MEVSHKFGAALSSILCQVHLSSPPQQSYYWRWHNAGPGMVSTIEAVYYAAWEILQQKYRHLVNSEPNSKSLASDLLMDQNNLIHLLWLFGHQRAAAFEAAQKTGKPAPFSDEGKEMRRVLRIQKGTGKHLRDKEVGKALREQCRSLKDCNLAKNKEVIVRE